MFELKKCKNGVLIVIAWYTIDSLDTLVVYARSKNMEETVQVSRSFLASI